MHRRARHRMDFAPTGPRTGHGRTGGAPCRPCRSRCAATRDRRGDWWTERVTLLPSCPTGLRTFRIRDSSLSLPHLTGADGLDHPARELIDDFHHFRYPTAPLPPRFVCLGTPLATCALPKGVGFLGYLLTFTSGLSLEPPHPDMYASIYSPRSETKPKSIIQEAPHHHHPSYVKRANPHLRADTLGLKIERLQTFGSQACARNRRPTVLP